MKTKLYLVLLLVGLVVAGTITANGSQEEGTAVKSWPQSSVTMYVPAKAGGGTDVMSRILASGLQRVTGENFVVVNQASGAGTVAYESTRNSDPDGSAMMVWHPGFYVNYYTGTYNYSPNDDFTPLGIVFGGMSQAFVAHADAPYNNMKELVEYAKQHPGEVTYGCQKGGSAHLVAGILMDSTEIDLRLVDAASQTDKITGILGKNISISAITSSAAKQYVDSGQMKVLGLVDSVADPKYPEFIPAVKQGYPRCYWDVVLLLYGPAGMDHELQLQIESVLQKLNDDEEFLEQTANAKAAFVFTDIDSQLSVYEDYDAIVKNTTKEIGISVR